MNEPQFLFLAHGDVRSNLARSLLVGSSRQGQQERQRRSSRVTSNLEGSCGGLVTSYDNVKPKTERTWSEHPAD